MLQPEEINQIDRFVAESKKILGKEVRERALWNTCASEDAIRHFASGIGDDNPLFTDPDYGSNGPYGRQTAPPAFLTSVLYPILHGAPIPVPLWFLVGEVTYEWFLPIIAEDRFQAMSKSIDLFDTKGSIEERKIYIISETCYTNQHDMMVGKCIGTTVCIPKNEGRLLIDRPIYEYSEKEIEKIGDALKGESRKGDKNIDVNELVVGHEMPTFARGPLSLGDLICWQSAIGPAYQSGAPGFRNLAKSPRAVQKNPVTGWPVEDSQQHEDFLLTSQRGMPLPFDQGVMRFACLSPMITNWIGDRGFLNSLSVKIIAPNLYGDTTWYHGSISERSDGNETISLMLKINGKNQLGETTTAAEAKVTFPRKDVLTFHRYARCRDRSPQNSVKLQETWAKNLFENQVSIRPEAVSLVFGETRLTYEDVDYQASRLAEGLLSLGVKANEPVAICMERSHNFILAILGILKAGAVYVPMDPDYPRKRLTEMLKDSQPQVLIIDSSCDMDFPEYSGKIVPFYSLLRSGKRKNDGYHLHETKMDDLAYIMYTSGSEGTAKGVPVTHGNLSSYIFGLKQTFDITASDIFVHTASFAFSASVRQIFLPLCTGAKIVIADTEQRSDPVALAELIRRENVTHWDTVPSFLSLFCETFIELDSSAKSKMMNNRLRRIMVTGEPLTWDTCRTWYQTLKQGSELINLYSQTETSGTVCAYEVSKDPENISGVVPIGRPLPGTTVYILNEDRRPVSYLEIGEICVTGPRISMGYLNLPDLTARQFISQPFRAGSNDCLFRTGDLGCFLPDGNIVTKGRKDKRVKIRGFRIELEEVDKALRVHPEIRQAVTVVSNEKGNDGRLLAYCIPKRKPAPRKTELRSFLQASLPDYMLPAIYIFLEELPLNPNGKVDYQALPVPDFTQLEMDGTFVAPYTSVESRVAGIWADVLKIDHVGTHDNFFDLGGHSLLAARILAKLRSEFKIDLTIQNIFDAPTIAEFALFITRSRIEESLSNDAIDFVDELESMSEEEAQKLLEEEIKTSKLTQL